MIWRTRYLPLWLWGLIVVTVAGCTSLRKPDHNMDLYISSLAGKGSIFSRSYYYDGHYKVGTPYQINQAWYRPGRNDQYDEQGFASWYGPNFHGKRTANGERYSQHMLTAAHPTLPLPSMVEVTNLLNGRTLHVMVNDRGPYAKQRVIDLSAQAAERLGFKRQGVTKVRVRFLRQETGQLLVALGLEARDGSRAKYPIQPAMFAADPIERRSIAPQPLLLLADASARVPPSRRHDATKEPLPAVLPRTDLLAGVPVREGRMVSTKDSAVKAPRRIAPAPTAGVLTALTIPPRTQLASFESSASKPTVHASLSSQPVHRASALPPSQGKQVFVQLGAYSNAERAAQEAKRFGNLGKAFVHSSQASLTSAPSLHRVRMGPFSDRNDANKMVQKLSEMGMKVIIVE